MNSRWQANKIGFLNFWYYDEQEFAFSNGRMLLRGSNGSGKSVTMQSVVPLLLDGNMSPERLDPFGSRDRKMIGYLLEEDDEREERTGYLYMEFKRVESETYLTIGMGIRARRGKQLDKWYFGIADGRRIGKDFFLYKETDERVPFSKKELENRLAGGGVLFDRQSDYMAYVNRMVFGFDTVDEYREMLDLLIQLRTPKLSKDFKPTVINEILSDSLQPLSDEDLRPMSEAIENMDAMNMNLKSRQEGKQAAEKIYRVLDRYNRLNLYEKAERLETNQKQRQQSEREKKAQETERDACIARRKELGEERNRMEAKRQAMEKERDSLNKSDAVALKTREEELNVLLQEKEKQLQEQEARLRQKQEQFTDMEARQREEENRRYQKELELLDILEEMDEEAEEMSFDEHTYFGKNFKEHFQEAFSFDDHATQVKRTGEGIRQGLEILRREDTCRRQVEEKRLDIERQHRKTDAAQREITKRETTMVETQNDYKEQLYTWNASNEELKLARETLIWLSEFVDDYTENSDFAAAKQPVADQWMACKGALNDGLLQKERLLRENGEQLAELRKELDEWENHKEPEPERSEAVRKNRERLNALGISYQEFYKVIEFGQDLDPAACDRLEEALLHMGILDALVVDEADRERVLAADPGCQDRYLFTGKENPKKSLLDVLDLNDEVNDLFLNQRMLTILSGIAYGDEDGSDVDGGAEKNVSTRILENGTYQIGVLTGTVTGEYKAGFLGTRARERNRQEKIARCREAIAALEEEENRLSREAEELRSRIGKLALEYDEFPGDENLRKACRLLADAVRESERLNAEALRMEGELKELSERQKELYKEALQIAEKLALKCSYETFLRADEASRSYGQHFYQLKSGHEVYRQILSGQENLRERMEDLEADMDQIRYDAGNTERARKRETAERDSIREQLKLTDYEEIRERLDACVKWLNEYPQAMQTCVVEQTRQEERIRALDEQLEKGEEQMEELTRKGAHLTRCYEAELALGCVDLPPELAAVIGKTGGLSAKAEEGMSEEGMDGLSAKPTDRMPAEAAGGFSVKSGGLSANVTDASPMDRTDGKKNGRRERAVAATAPKIRAFLEPGAKDLQKDKIIAELNQVFFENRGQLTDYQPVQISLFEDLDKMAEKGDPSAKRLDIQARYQGIQIPFRSLLEHLERDIEELKELIHDSDRELFEDILSNTVSRKIRAKINSSMAWVEKMNALMGSMNTSSGLKLSLRWRSRTAESEDQLDTRDLVDLLKKDYRVMREDEAERLSRHFRSKVDEARRSSKESGGAVSFYQVMKDALDYRKWFEFQLYSQKTGERQKELTNSVFGTFSGGEKAMSMYVPLFSAVVAKYQGGRADAPRIISLDEAFAGVDNRNIRDMFRLMSEFEFDFIINSQVLWGDCDTLDALAIYQLHRPENAKFVTVMSYRWNGRYREMIE
ncbi:MAG: TIGR02680 family protein [Lachnospiraceae bacterium]|nr:TIGR02680 family protein [Lachnospiraceae bacterium]